jgi:hypothetical protein
MDEFTSFFGWIARTDDNLYNVELTCNQRHFMHVQSILMMVNHSSFLILTSPERSFNNNYLILE